MADLTRDRFVELLQDDLDLDVTADDLHLPLDSLPGWDSVRTLTLFTALEKETARELSLPDLDGRVVADDPLIAVALDEAPVAVMRGRRRQLGVGGGGIAEDRRVRGEGPFKALDHDTAGQQAAVFQRLHARHGPTAAERGRGSGRSWRHG